MKAAIDDMHDHVIAHEEFSQSFLHSAVTKWTSEVEAWEKDLSQPNPYVLTVEVPSQAAIRCQLSEVEAKELVGGHDITLDDVVSPSILIAFGMDLEAEQQALRVELGKCKINVWITKQQLYIPGVVALQTMAEVASAIDGPQNFPLWLPSQIGTQIPFNTCLAELEWELWYSQAHDGLNSLQKNLQILPTPGHARVDASGDEYQAAHTALSSLGALLGKLGWQTRFLPLTDANKRELTEVEPGMSEGKCSWIWKTTNEQWWKTKGQLDMGGPAMNLGGLHAYAERQAALRCLLQEHFAGMWSDIPRYVEITTTAMADTIKWILGQARVESEHMMS
ncbi:hypothetical protein L208DRAFT_1377620 [Tricholoma matsutake]|nr:hypothetical protein L208DRAFT_1377620 [Tricholoma matsutake 945]